MRPMSGSFNMPLVTSMRARALTAHGVMSSSAEKSYNELWLLSSITGRPDAPTLDHSAELGSMRIFR